MLVPFALLVAASVSQTSPGFERLRTILPNGAVVLAERMPEAKTLSVQLFASSRRVPETAETHGYRHLLEHVAALGPNRDLDQRLESNGCFLLARTHRDAMQFEITCPPGQFDLALSALQGVLSPINVTAEQLEREKGVLKQELVLLPDSVKLGAAGWLAAYKEMGIDPVGSEASISKATVESLRDVQQKQFSADGLVVVVSGPIEIAQATAKASKLLSGLKVVGPKPPGDARGMGVAGRAEAAGSFGEARAARVRSFRDTDTVARIAAGFAIASQFPDTFFIYTPSVRNGLVIVGRTSENSGIGMKVDAMTRDERLALFPIGKLLAKNWLESRLQTPSGSAYLRGMLLVQSQAVTPEDMMQAILNLGQNDFEEGMAAFAKDNCVVCVGVER